MYLEHFGLDSAPFSITPDPRFVYLTRRHREALAHLLYGLREGGGFVQLTGEVGTGKTTICRMLLQQLPQQVDVALIFNPPLTRRDLLDAMFRELRIEVPAGETSDTALVDRLHDHLLAANAGGRRTVLILDEAQNLDDALLEQVRLLTNLETDDTKLLQVFLIGQPELREILDRRELRQVAQRVTARYHLEPLDRLETEEYVGHRLAVAGARRRLFSASAIRRVHRLSQGIPRRINILCDRALLGAYSSDLDAIGPGVVNRAQRELNGDPGPALRTRPALLVGAAVLAILGSMVLTSGYAPALMQMARDGLDDARALWGPESDDDVTDVAPSVATPAVATAPAQTPSVAAPPTPTGPSAIAAPPTTAVPSTVAASPTVPVPPTAPVPPTVAGSPTAVAPPTAPTPPTAATPASVTASPAIAPPAEPEPLASAAPAVAPPTPPVDADVVNQGVAPSRAAGPDAQGEPPAADPPPAGAPPPPRLSVALASLPDDGLDAAVAALATPWRLPSPASGRAPCEWAANHGLACYDRSLTWDELIALDLPAVLRVAVEPEGSAHVALLGIDGERARVAVGDRRIDAPVLTLRTLWQGEQILLWRAPGTGRDLIRRGEEGSSVLWLRQRLSDVDGEPVRPEAPFDDALRERVLAFQEAQGLKPDGIVGPLTQILLLKAGGARDGPVLRGSAAGG